MRKNCLKNMKLMKRMKIEVISKFEDMKLSTCKKDSAENVDEFDEMMKDMVRAITVIGGNAVESMKNEEHF